MPKKPAKKVPAKPTAKPKMLPRKGARPGLETDGHAAVIPVKKRTPDDRAKVARASAKKKKKKG